VLMISRTNAMKHDMLIKLVIGALA